MLGETIVQGICVIEMWRNERTHKTIASRKIQKLSYPTDATDLVESFFANTANLGFKRKMRVDYHPQVLNTWKRNDDISSDDQRKCSR
jgi:hypothetical protein